ncbi:MAG: Uma2 family endonuclease [Bacteroidia bacterium]
MGQKAILPTTLETYIEIEASSKERYEYYDGHILAMAGGSPEYGQLQVNTDTALNNALRAAGKPCRTFSSDVKVAIQSVRRRFYPDLSVVCGPVERDQKETQAITNPVLVVEILSESTESLDRGEKFWGYRQLSSLREYMLISQDKVVIEIFSRAEDDTWRIQTLTAPGQTADLPALGIRLNVEDIYFGMENIMN